MVNTEGLLPGSTVMYRKASTAAPQRGVVKEVIDNQHAFVVYHCNNEWEQFRKYTGQHTNVKYLSEGWPDGTTLILE